MVAQMTASKATYVLCAADDDGEPVGKSYTCWSFKRAVGLAQDMARERRLEVVVEH